MVNIQPYERSHDVDAFYRDLMSHLPSRNNDSPCLKLLKKALILFTDQSKIKDPITAQKLYDLTLSMDNEGDFDKCRLAFAKVMPSGTSVRRSLLESESPYFKTMLHSSMYNSTSPLLKCENWDNHAQQYALTYLKAADSKRHELLGELTNETALHILLSAGEWQTWDLINHCDQYLTANWQLDEDAWNLLESLDLSPFTYLKTLYFLCKLEAATTKAKPFDEVIQEKARLSINLETAAPSKVLVCESNHHFLREIDIADIVPIELALDQTLFHIDNLESIYSIAKKYNSRPLLASAFKLEMSVNSIPVTESQGNEYVSSPKTLDHVNNVFTPAPCSVGKTELFIEPQSISDHLIELLMKYQDLPIGISLTPSQCTELAEKLKKSIGVTVLNLIADDTEKALPKGQALEAIFNAMPKLTLLVVPQKMDGFFKADDCKSVLNLLRNKKVPIWKNLCGVTKSVECANYVQTWKKFPDVYLELKTQSSA